MFKKIIPVFITLLLFTGCSATNTSVLNETTESSYVADKAVNQEFQSDRSIDLDYDYTLESNKFDENYEQLKSLINEEDVIITNSNLDNFDDRRTFNVSIKVPRDKTKQFEEKISEIGKVISVNKYMSDITQEKSDNNINLEAKEKELEAYKRLYEQAQSVEEIMKIQERISLTESEINNYKNIDKNIKESADYTNMQITLREVVNYSNKKDSSPKIIDTIVSSSQKSIYLLKLFFIGIISFIFSTWWLLLIGAIIIYFINKKKGGKKSK